MQGSQVAQSRARSQKRSRNAEASGPGRMGPMRAGNQAQQGQQGVAMRSAAHNLPMLTALPCAALGAPRRATHLILLYLSLALL